MVGESSGERIDLWRPGRDREAAGSVCWNSPGTIDLGVRGLGTPALGRTGPAATASFTADLVLEDLGVARPHGNFSESSLLGPRDLHLGLLRPLLKYRRWGWSR